MRLARQSKNIRLIDMAKLVGYSKSYLFTVETGNKTPSLDMIQKYEYVLGLKLGELAETINKAIKTNAGDLSEEFQDSKGEHLEVSVAYETAQNKKLADELIKRENVFLSKIPLKRELSWNLLTL